MLKSLEGISMKQNYGQFLLKELYQGLDEHDTLGKIHRCYKSLEIESKNNLRKFSKKDLDEIRIVAEHAYIQRTLSYKVKHKL